jgi:hypothetical protein
MHCLQDHDCKPHHNCSIVSWWHNHTCISSYDRDEHLPQKGGGLGWKVWVILSGVLVLILLIDQCFTERKKAGSRRNDRKHEVSDGDILRSGVGSKQDTVII